MTVNTAPTHLTTMQYARLQQWREELCAIARKALDNPDHPGDPDTLARWAADDLVPDGLFYTAPPENIEHILRGTYRAMASEPEVRKDTAHERYVMLTYDFETTDLRESGVASLKGLEPSGWEGLDNLVNKETD